MNLKRSLVHQQEDEPDRDLSHAIKFFEMSGLMHEFLATITGKSLDPNWEICLDAFKAAAKEFFRPCQHIGMSNIQFNMKFNHHFRNFVSSFNGAYEEVH